jgi:sialidase-1
MIRYQTMKNALIRLALLLFALVIVLRTANAQPTVAGFEKARFIVPPDIFIHHSPERSFIGPGMFVLDNGDILMAAPWGRPPTNFEQLAAKYPVPMLYRSADGGRTWKERGRMRMEWPLSGMVSDGGVSFLRLKDGRLAALLHRHVKDLHGGGLPAISFSKDDGATWTPARLVGKTEGVWYVMNERLIQLRSGRLLVPVAHMPQGSGLYEGDKNIGLCFLSDDGGETWQRSRTPAKLDDARGMAEPCVAEVGERVLMLARTGSGFHYASWSDDGGDTWSKPEATTLESACSSLTLKTLPDGRLIVLYNHAKPLNAGAFFPRTPLCYAVSDDGGKTWTSPVIVDDEGATNKDRQNIYPAACFTKEGMLVMWSTHQADPKGSFAGQYDAKIGGGKRAILSLPSKGADNAANADLKSEPKPSAQSNKPLRILPLGDSITRGSYLAKIDGKSTGLPHPDGGGWRKTLQDKLRAANVAFDFVGELNYAAYGRDGAIDPQFDPDHHGLAGFSNAGIIKGGTVPTPADVLASLGVKEVKVPGIVDVLKKHRPDVILLMSGANGFDAPARDRLIRTIGETSPAHLFVATILPQKAPRAGWDKVSPYNASLSATVAAQQAAGKRITLVDMHAAITTDDLLPDGVHPNQAGMEKMAATWFAAVQAVAQTAAPSSAQPVAPSAASSPQQGTSHVIVPHSPEAARNGEASLIELRNGSLLLMYGAHQKTGDWDRGEIRQTRSRDGGKSWSAPETVFRDENRSLFQVAFARRA